MYHASCIVRKIECVRANHIVVVVRSVVCETMMSTAMRHTEDVVSMARAVACLLWSRGTKLRGVDSVVSKSNGKMALMMSVVAVHCSPKSGGMTEGMMMYSNMTTGMATREVRNTKVVKCRLLLIPEFLLKEAD